MLFVGVLGCKHVKRAVEKRGYCWNVLSDPLSVEVQGGNSALPLLPPRKQTVGRADGYGVFRGCGSAVPVWFMRAVVAQAVREERNIVQQSPVQCHGHPGLSQEKMT